MRLTNAAAVGRKDVVFAIQALLAGPIGRAGTGPDLESFTDLCCMTALPSGAEDPKAILRSLSDSFLETAKLHFKTVLQNRVARNVAQFLFIEWCFRHGHLEEDWRWEWRSDREGDLRYLERVPLRTLSQGFPD